MIPTKPFSVSQSVLFDDELLADAIDSDGRALIDAGVAVSLERYFAAVPDLEERHVPLDAAVDVALRSVARSRGSEVPGSSDAELVASAYPRLRHVIHDAISLEMGLFKTQAVRSSARTEPRVQLPHDFGPLLPDGRERYTLTRLIGSGASGTVYSATDRHLSEPDSPAEVAIKILSTHRTDQWLARRLTEEATKARRVDHPSVVRVLDRGGESTETPFIVYELVKGGDLQSWLEKRSHRVSVREAVRVSTQIARGVQAAHSAGLVHSDLKPANVLIDEKGQAKVADFGIAARLHRSMMELPSRSGDATSGGPVGNLAFIAPEQFRGEPGCFSVPADVYALGGVLFYLLTGALPNGDSPANVARLHGDRDASAASQPPSARALNSKIDFRLDAICKRALAPVPSNRYSSASSLADDLEAWLENRPIAWQRPSVLSVVTLWIKRRPAVAAISAVALLVLLAGVVTTANYAAVVKRKNDQLLDQNQRMRDAVQILIEAEKTLGPKAPGVTDPRAGKIFEQLRPITPLVEGGIKDVDGREENTSVEPQQPPSPNPSRSNP